VIGSGLDLLNIANREWLVERLIKDGGLLLNLLSSGERLIFSSRDLSIRCITWVLLLVSLLLLG